MNQLLCVNKLVTFDDSLFVMLVTFRAREDILKTNLQLNYFTAINFSAKTQYHKLAADLSFQI